jgi:small subunit ribosomal protein S16
MAVKVRLMRIGAKGRPFYRVVAVDERRKRTGSYLELLGTYNPLTTPKEINLKQDRIDAWVKNGAQLSSGFLRIIGKAPRKPERKAKKDKGGSSSTPAAAPVEEKPAEEIASTTEEVVETPIETTPEFVDETNEAPAEVVESKPEESTTPAVEETPVEKEVSEEKAE